MNRTAPDQGAGGRVEYEHRSDGIIEVTFAGDIDFDLLQVSSDKILEFIQSGCRHFLLQVAHAYPLFTPIDVMDEFHRAFHTPVRGVRFAYVAPKNLFGKHFMLIEAAAFNAGITVIFKTNETEAIAWLKAD
ncbi:hypothetical protein [Hyphobacterium sp.]|uniref:hypothetical protein n=1 Tax=Hyphobacterium sp. TaxID=2004662 RepID=UPI003B51E75E